MFDGMSDTMWKWKYKVTHVHKKNEKNLGDFSSDSIAAPDGALPNGSKRATPAAVTKEPGTGSNLAVQTLYEGPKSGENHYDWVDYPPKQLSKSAAARQDRVAIKVFKVKDGDKPVISGRSPLKYYSVVVQTPPLVAILADVLKKYDTHIDVNETATFAEPFKPLYFGYDDIVAKYKGLADDNAVKPFMLLFIRLVDDILGETRVKVKNQRSGGLISFKYAWTYFPKDCVVITYGNNCDLVCKVDNTAYEKVSPTTKVLVLRCKVLRFNGDAFIWETAELKIPQFEGNMPVTDLDHYPLEFRQDSEAVKSRLGARGRKVLDYQGLTYCTYNGMAIFREGKKVERHNVNGRILIDVFGYNKHHLSKGVREGSDPDTQKNTVNGTGLPMDPMDVYNRLIAMRTPAPGGEAPSEPRIEEATAGRRITDEIQAKNKKAMLAREDELMFINPLLEGFALKNKLWLSFFVEDITPIVWNNKAYDHLVYDEQQKDLVMSFVENHGRVRQRMEDVIVGKGEGLINLLSGPPGTGKTLMAEAVADRTHRPLFYLQAEDLGINAATLGANIKKVFEMATEWNAVILLDEADVFMAERHPHDIARNELVSIFLRELEYFSGIIFLTTNLYSTIDSAFRSRVSLHLLFKALSLEARVLIWRKFLDRLPPTTTRSKGKEPADDTNTVEPAVELDDDDVRELAAWELNGREIKNAVKMVQSWCDHKGYEMDLARLENGIKVTSPHASKATPGANMSLYDE